MTDQNIKTRNVFLHIFHEDTRAILHMYYTGYYDVVNEHLQDLISDSDNLINFQFEFSSKPFDGIEANRYVRI